MIGHVATMGAKRNAYKMFVGKPEGKLLLGRPACRWKNNIKMVFRYIGWLRTETIGGFLCTLGFHEMLGIS